MRVGLLFNHAAIVGGGELSFLDLATELPACGVTPVAIVPGPGEVADRLGQAGVETASLIWPALRGAGILRCPATVAMRSLVVTSVTKG